MGRITGNEYTTFAIVVGKAEPQFPEADIVELYINGCTNGCFEKCLKVEIVLGGSWCHRRMEEPVAVEINPAKELPVTVHVWVDGIEDRLVAIN